MCSLCGTREVRWTSMKWLGMMTKESKRTPQIHAGFDQGHTTLGEDGSARRRGQLSVE